MLDLKKISYKNTHSEAWHKEKLGKFSASSVVALIGDKSDQGIFTKGAITHIEGKAGEICTGQPAEKEFFNDDTDWGNSHEPESLDYFSENIGRPFLRNEHDNTTHRLIIQNDYMGCTPDALMPVNPNNLFDSTGNFLNVETVEGKCPPKHHRFIKLFKCLTPEDLKSVEAKYYWQVICQMHFCGAIKGWFFVYHPNFNGQKQLRKIEFSKLALLKDFTKLQKTLEFAQAELIRTVNLFKN